MDYGEVYIGKIEVDESITGQTKIQVPYMLYNNSSLNSYQLKNEGDYPYTFNGGIHSQSGNPATFFNLTDDNPFNFSYKENDVEPAWMSSITSNETLYIRKGDWKATIYRRSPSDKYFCIKVYQNDVYKNEFTTPQMAAYRYGEKQFISFAIFNDKLYSGFIYYATAGGYCATSALLWWGNLINDAIAPTYTFKPFEQLSGNNGQFLMNLSTIDETIIGDGETQTSSTDASKFVLTERTSLYNLSVNMLDGQEYTIAYCGDNYLNMLKRTVVGSQSTVIYVTLKFYFRSDVLIYTSDEMQITRIGTTFPNDYYLSIIYDDNEEVAALDCINHFSNVYYYNNFSLPSDEQMRALYIWLQDNGNAQSSDPYGTGSTDDGGEPDGNRLQDNITDSPLPTCGGLELGFVTLYRPTDTQLGQIASFLWSDNVLDNFKKYFNNFADNILSLYSIPFTPSSLPTKTFKVGNMTSEITGVEYCTVRYFDIDMGQLEVKNQWGSYLDYSPYTKMEIYLPYLGLHSLDADEIMSPARMDGSMPDKQGTILSLTYRLDILTGIIVAKIKVRVYKKNGTYSDEIRYQFSGRVGSICPLTGQTYAGYIQTAAVEFTGLVSTIASGGLAAPMAGAAAVTATVAAQKPTVERVGSVVGDASMMATNVPYLCISVPNKPFLDRQQKFTGFPSYKSGTLSNFTGFTQVLEAHVEGISCTEEERSLILTMLKEGVLI